MTRIHRRNEDVETIESPFNTVTVRRRGRWVDLDVEGATYASYHPDRLLTGYSWDALAAGALLGAPEGPRSVLLLGLGGGTCLRQLRAASPHVALTAVEIDPAVVKLARRYMDLDAIEVEVVTEDAYAYLKRCRARFDVVIDDLFLTGAEDVYRSGIPEGEGLETLARRCRPGGVVVANLITDVGHAAVRRRTRAAFKARFASVRTVKPPRGLNEVIVGGPSVLSKSALTGYAGAFPDAEDKKLWRRLSVRKLK